MPDGGTPARTAVLVRRQQVDLDDVSRRGCRLTGAERLGVGEVGMLTVDIGGQLHVELFRVSRSRAVPGDGNECRYEAALEFLPMPAGAPSLHDLAAHLDDLHAS